MRCMVPVVALIFNFGGQKKMVLVWLYAGGVMVEGLHPSSSLLRCSFIYSPSPAAAL